MNFQNQNIHKLTASLIKSCVRYNIANAGESTSFWGKHSLYLPLFLWFPGPSQPCLPFPCCFLICGPPRKVSDGWGVENSRTGLSPGCRRHRQWNPDPNQPRGEGFLLNLPMAIVQITCMLTRFWNPMLSNWPRDRGTAHVSAMYCKRKSASSSSLECRAQRSHHSVQVNHPASVRLVPVTCKTKPGLLLKKRTLKRGALQSLLRDQSKPYVMKTIGEGQRQPECHKAATQPYSTQQGLWAGTPAFITLHRGTFLNHSEHPSINAEDKTGLPHSTVGRMKWVRARKPVSSQPGTKPWWLWSWDTSHEGLGTPGSEHWPTTVCLFPATWLSPKKHEDSH